VWLGLFLYGGVCCGRAGGARLGKIRYGRVRQVNLTGEKRWTT
jgi:hypothetical protein